MKKGILILALMLMFTGVVQASSIHGTFEGYNIVKVYGPDGELTAANPAINFKGTTMVPIRMIEQLGFTVEWDAETYSVTVTPPEPVVIEVEKQKIASEDETTTEEPGEEPGEEPTNPTEPGGSTEPTQPTDPSEPSDEEPQDQTEPTEPEEPEQPQEPEEPAEPDNKPLCDSIRNEYAYKISDLYYKGYSQGKIEYYKLQLEYERDQKLAENGCN